MLPDAPDYSPPANSERSALRRTGPRRWATPLFSLLLTC